MYRNTNSIRTSRTHAYPAYKNSKRVSISLTDLLNLNIVGVIYPRYRKSKHIIISPYRTYKNAKHILSTDRIIISVPTKDRSNSSIHIPNVNGTNAGNSSANSFIYHINIPDRHLRPRTTRKFRVVNFTVPFVILKILLGILTRLAIVVTVPLLINVILINHNNNILRRTNT